MAAPVNANINILVNTEQATAQIRALQAQINTFNKSVVAANSAAARQQVALNKALLDAANASGMFNAKIVPTTAGIERFSQALDKGKLSLSEYTRGAASQLPGMRRVFTREFDLITKVAEDRVKRLQTQYTALGNAQKALALQPVALDMQNMATQTAMAAQRQMIFNKMIDDGSTKLLNWGKNTQWAGRQLMVGFTLPLTMFGATAAKVFMDLDKQARDFKRVYGDLFTPPAEIESNLKAIQQLGDEYTKYGVKVSDTMQVAATAAAAGMRNEKLIAGTEESLRLATIGQIDYNQALDTTISLQTAFKMSADDLAPSVDFLGAVANQTVLTIDDMTKAIPRVAPVVQGLGGDVKDLAAMLVAMREGGVSAENAANGLKSGLASLINPTNAAKEKLKELGINITAIVEANKGDLMGTVMDFGTALSKLGDFERQQALEKTFGKYQYARLGALFDNIIKKGGQAEVALTLAGKSAEELGQLSAKSLKEIEESTTAKFTGAVERLKVAIAPIGEAFLKALTPIIDIVTKIADKFNSLPDGVKNAVAIVTAVVAGIGPVVLMLVGLIANAGANIIKFIQMMRKGFARMRGDASAFEYLAGAELDAAAASQTLEGKASKLTSTLLIQEGAVRNLIDLYQRLASSAATAAGAMPTTLGGGARGGRGPRTAPPLRMATGGIVPGSGSGDKIPAMLEPGETVVTKKASQSYGPVLAAMNAGTLPGYQGGLTLPGVSVPTGLILSQGSRTAQSIQASFESLVRGLDDFSDISETASRVLKEIADNGERVTKSRFLEKMAEAGYTPRRMPSQLVGAHLTERRELSVSGETYLASKPGRGPGGKSIPAQAMLAASQDPEIRPFMREYSGLTAELSQTLNTQLQTGAAVSDFNEEWSRQGSRLLPSLEKFGGFVGDNAEDLKALSKLERLLSIRVNSRADVIETGIVTDAILVDETRKLIDDYKHAGGSIGKVALAADRAASTITQVSILMSKEQAQALVNQGKARRVETDREFRYISNSGVVLGRESKESGTWRTERVGEQLATTSGRSLTRQTVVAGRKEIGANSPAEAFAEIMDDAAKGMVVGAKRSSKVAGSAGTIVAQSAKQAYKKEMSQLRRDIRNVDYMQEFGMSSATMQTRTLRRLEESKARARQSEVREATRAAQLAQQNARLAAQTTTAMQQQNAGMTEQVAARGPGRMARARSFFTGGRGAGVGMGLMSAAMMAPMLPGQAGEIASQAQPALMAISTLSMLGPLFGALMNPVGLLVAGVVAAVGGVLLVKKFGDDVASKGRELAEAMNGTAKSLQDTAAFFGNKTWKDKLLETQIKAAGGQVATEEQKSQAQGYLESEVGQKLVSDIKMAQEYGGTKGATTALQNQLKTMLLSGAIAPDAAIAIAQELGKQLNNQDLAIDTTANIVNIVGADGRNLLDSDGRMKIIADIMADGTAFQNAMEQAGLVWDGSSWFSQISMVFSGSGTADIFAENIGAQIAAQQGIISNELSRLDQLFKTGKISVDEYTSSIGDLSTELESLGYEKTLEQAYKSVEGFDESAADRLGQSIVDRFKENLNMTSMGANGAEDFLNGFKKTFSVRTGARGGLTQTVNMFDPENVREAVAEFNKQGIAGRKKAAEIQKEFNATMNIALKVEAGEISAQKIADLVAQGKNPEDIVQILGIKFEFPDSKTESLFYASTRLLESGGGAYRLIAKYQAAGHWQKVQELSQLFLEAGAKGLSVDAIFNIEGEQGLRKAINLVTKLDNLPDPITKEAVMKFLNEEDPSFWYNIKDFQDLSPVQLKEFISLYRTLIASPEQIGATARAAVGSEILNLPGVSVADQQKIAEGDIMNKVKGMDQTETTTEDSKGGDGGGDKELSGLQKVWQNIKERLKLFTNFSDLMEKYKGETNRFNKAIKEATYDNSIPDQLRKMNLSESLIADILEQGSKEARKILNALKKRKGLAAQMNFADIKSKGSEAFSALQGENRISQIGMSAIAKAKINAPGVSSDVLSALAGDEALATEYAAKKTTKERRMQILLEVKTKVDNEQIMEMMLDPTAAQEKQLDLEKRQFAVRPDIVAHKERVKLLQDQIDLINKEISALEKMNETDRQSIRSLERQKEMIQRQIDQYERQNEMDQRRIDALRREDELRNRISDAISRDLEIMSQQENIIREQYQKRIDALENINSLNDRIVESQRQQLGLSQALSQGDIYAAAAAAQEMQASQGQYARQQQTAALQQGMENQIAGLTTSGGLTRQQAEEQINAIKQQSYQTSLQIRDIEDGIYQRNLLIVPLKDQQYRLDLAIRDISDAIFNRETEILGIQNSKLSPVQQALSDEQDMLTKKEEQFETYVAEQELAIERAKLEEEQKKLVALTNDEVGNLADTWYEVTKQIQDANKAMEFKLGELTAPSWLAGDTSDTFSAKVADYEAAKNRIREERNSRVNAARQKGEEASKALASKISAQKKYAGGYIKNYSNGSYVLGNGGRDSVPAMLTPGEFVIRKAMVDKYGLPTFNKMNMGALPRYKVPGKQQMNQDVQKQALTIFAPRAGDTGYNNISVNVNVPNTNASPDAIANRVAMKIQDIDRRGIGNGRVYKQ